MGYKIKSSLKHYMTALPHHALETTLTNHRINSNFEEQSVLSATFSHVGPIGTGFFNN
jgi:hypothetical protein